MSMNNNQISKQISQKIEELLKLSQTKGINYVPSVDYTGGYFDECTGDYLEGYYEEYFELSTNKLEEILTKEDFDVYTHVYQYEELGLGFESEMERYSEEAHVKKKLSGIIESNYNVIESIIDDMGMPERYETLILKDTKELFEKVTKETDKLVMDDLIEKAKEIRELKNLKKSKKEN